MISWDLHFPKPVSSTIFCFHFFCLFVLVKYFIVVHGTRTYICTFCGMIVEKKIAASGADAYDDIYDNIVVFSPQHTLTCVLHAHGLVVQFFKTTFRYVTLDAVMVSHCCYCYG